MKTVAYKGKQIETDARDLKAFLARHETEYDPVLVTVDGKPTELFHSVKDGTAINPIPLDHAASKTALSRLALFMVIKAFYSTAGKQNVRSIHVDFSMENSFFIRPEGDFVLDENLLSTITAKMHKYIDQAWPIKKKSYPTKEAIAIFEKYGMQEKADLFKYRLSGKVNLYSLGQFQDYFYGHMPPDCSYCPPFSLVLFQGGLFLHIGPGEFEPGQHAGMFAVLHESGFPQCKGVADLNRASSKGQTSRLIEIQEALQEKEIGKIAERIVQDAAKKVVMIAGPSSSSKTTFARRLCTQLEALGRHPVPISVDDYFVDRELSPRNPDGSFNFEKLECLDLETLNGNLKDLLDGKTIHRPTYNFVTGKREYHNDYLKLADNDILVIEGIHALNDRMSYALPASSKFKIYISALSQLSIDEHNPVSSSDGRLLRRIVRDARTRGCDASGTISMWPTVKRGEDENITPYRESADIIFNSALVYELAVLKTFAEPLLFDIGPDDPNHEEARRLLKFLDYFLAISSEAVPKNSLLREFIG